jgi:hypothetical protein
VSSNARHWQRVVEAYRNEDWHDCIRRIRPLVEADPFALSLRQLLARLYIRVGNPRLALLQYERLLPLAIGKRDLFRALAVQKHLDQMQASGTPHQDRFLAMHRWFCSLGPAGASADSPGGKAGALALLRLPAERFANAAEACVLETLDLEPSDVEARPGTCWVVTSGRLRWSIVEPEGGPAGETLVEEGSSIAIDSAAGDPVRLRFVPELPTDCLRFDPEIATALVGSDEIEAGQPAVEVEAPAPPVAETAECDREPAPGLAFAAACDAPAADSDAPCVAAEASVAREQPAGSPEPALAAPSPEPAAAADTTKPAPPPRPMPDRFAEPCLAVGVPFDSRNETRVAISVHSRVVLLGLVGTRVAPLTGTLVDLNARGACCRFSKAELRYARDVLENALVNLRLILPGAAEPVALVAEVRWAEPEEAGPGASEESGRRVGLEFRFVAERDQALIREFLERAGSAAGGSAAEPSPAKSLDGGHGSA